MLLLLLLLLLLLILLRLLLFLFLFFGAFLRSFFLWCFLDVLNENVLTCNKCYVMTYVYVLLLHLECGNAAENISRCMIVIKSVKGGGETREQV